jgi:hypothetical protein
LEHGIRKEKETYSTFPSKKDFVRRDKVESTKGQLEKSAPWRPEGRGRETLKTRNVWV